MRAHEFITEAPMFGYTKELATKLHQLEKMPHNPTLERYTGSLASEVNDLLHRAFRDHQMSEYNYKKLLDYVMSIDRALKKKVLKKDIILYTGVPHSPAKAWDAYKQDPAHPIRVHLPAYTSTTTRFETADEFAKWDSFDPQKHPVINSPEDNSRKTVGGPHILEIHVPAGLTAGSVKHFSWHKEEDEFVLPRGLDIEISPNPVNYMGSYVWQAKIVGHRPFNIAAKRK